MAEHFKILGVAGDLVVCLSVESSNDHPILRRTCGFRCLGIQTYQYAPSGASPYWGTFGLHMFWADMALPISDSRSSASGSYAWAWKKR